MRRAGASSFADALVAVELVAVELGVGTRSFSVCDDESTCPLRACARRAVLKLDRSPQVQTIIGSAVALEMHARQRGSLEWLPSKIAGDGAIEPLVRAIERPLR